MYDIFLNPLIGFDVVNNSDFVIVDSHSKSDFPLFNFINFVFLSDFFVFENFPIRSPKSIPNKIIFFAHGDNIKKMEFTRQFKNCIGTTQSKPFSKIQNFGGFTDGDRGVFLANYFGAKKIILFGMDFGDRIGKFSNTKKSERKTKLMKLQRGKSLLEWLATITKSELFTTSKPINGFKKISYKDVDIIIT